MTQLLISVRSLFEAQVARQPGVDLIDLKEPLRGSLGCPDLSVARQVSKYVTGPLSIALGELNQWPGQEELSKFVSGYRYAKMGLAGLGSHANWRDSWLDFADRMPLGTAPVLVAYADWKDCGAPSVNSVFEFASRTLGSTLLIDTFQKRRGRLFDHLDPLTLKSLRNNHPDVCLALAGSIQVEDQDKLADLAPDIIALRGAVCMNGRTSPLDSTKIAVWAKYCQSLPRSGAAKVFQTS